MKAGRPHNVYLSQRALGILVAFKTRIAASSYLHPGRYETCSNGKHGAARGRGNSDWIEKYLAREWRGVRAVYNQAEYADQHMAVLQAWANILDGRTREGKGLAVIGIDLARGRSRSLPATASQNKADCGQCREPTALERHSRRHCRIATPATIFSDDGVRLGGPILKCVSPLLPGLVRDHV